MKAYLYSLKRAFIASPFWISFYIVLTSLPYAILTGVALSAQRNMLNGASLYVSGSITLNSFITLVVLFFVFQIIKSFLQTTIAPFVAYKIDFDVYTKTNIFIHKKYLKLKLLCLVQVQQIYV